MESKRPVTLHAPAVLGNIRIDGREVDAAIARRQRVAVLATAGIGARLSHARAKRRCRQLARGKRGPTALASLVISSQRIVHHAAVRALEQRLARRLALSAKRTAHVHGCGHVSPLSQADSRFVPLHASECRGDIPPPRTSALDTEGQMPSRHEQSVSMAHES